MTRAIAILTLVLGLSLSLFAQDYWGLRNINTRAGDEVYNGFGAHWYCYDVSWERTEVQDDQFNWQNLDNSLDLTQRYNGEAVLVVSCNAGWATGGAGEKAPEDLDTRTPLNVDPPERGYSESIYDFAENLVNHIAERERPVVKYLRYVNEPEYNWVMTRDYVQDIEDYVRCLRTFYIAVHAAAAEHELDLRVSHGGFNYSKSLVRHYYRMGEENEELRDSLITLIQSRFERHATRVRSWDDVGLLVNSRGGLPPNYWTDVMAGQTDYLDWFDVHYHFKPRFLFDELHSFEQTVQDSGGEVKPWLAAEAAMQLAQGGLTDYEERFHAADMARKWILGMAFGLEGICTPMTGYPPEHFFGLFDDDQEEYLSATTYRFLRSVIQPVNEPEDNSSGQFRRFTFHEEATDVQVMWQDLIFDTREGMPYDLNIECGEEYAHVIVNNYLGEVLATIEHGNDSLLSDVDYQNEPIIIVYERCVTVDNDEIHITPDGFQLDSIYPNPFNSQFIVSYTLVKQSEVSIRLYSLTGAEVWMTSNVLQGSGTHQFKVNGHNLPSGVYFVQVNAGNILKTRKIALIR